MVRYVIGDIHGRLQALKEVLTKSKFNYKKDKLIVLGDIVDGGYSAYEVVEELLKINDVKYIVGNHDLWFLDHIKSGWSGEIWLQQGGANTIQSYGGSILKERRIGGRVYVVTKDVNMPVTHQDFFNRGMFYYKEDEMLFVHGGFNPVLGLEKTNKTDLVWDRELIEFAKFHEISSFKKVFIGHTTTQITDNRGEQYICSFCKKEWKEFKRFCKCGSNRIHISKGVTSPLKFNNLIMMDCGAGWNGKLCIMNIDTEKYWLSKLQIPAVSH